MADRRRGHRVRPAERCRPQLERLENRCLPSFLFVAAQEFAVGSSLQSVAVADVNGDGKPDLVTANGFNGTVSVLLGNGDGTFQNAQNFAAGSLPHSLVVADVNGDGKPDLVTA
ncbi:MAG TPA: VCBS repeat-containing protein, partial [Gemmataceae bacterium]|nr:VCBS repeat-containing protein [Gemmataceae bacterium]